MVFFLPPDAHGAAGFSADISGVRVENHTTPLQSRYGDETIARRLTLQEHQRDQRILLRVEGSVPEYNLICERWTPPTPVLSAAHAKFNVNPILKIKYT